MARTVTPTRQKKNKKSGITKRQSVKKLTLIKKIQKKINASNKERPSKNKLSRKNPYLLTGRKKPKPYTQVLYLLQGGGALGAYQVGICSGLLENNYAPTWIMGTSIGAINGSIIAGSQPKDRVNNLNRFWNEVTSPFSNFLIESHDSLIRQYQSAWVTQCILLSGLPGFFNPHFINPWMLLNAPPNKLSFYDTTPLKNTLENIIDFDLINQQKVRLSLGAVNIEDGNPVHFDNTREKIRVEHILASCAIPPAFPAVRIKNKDYWDGGISSNTPLSVILDEKMENKILCFMVNLFPYQEKAPATLFDVINRRKDLEFVSQYQEILKYFCERHRLKLNLKRLWEESDKVHVDPFIKKEVKNESPATLNIILFQYKNRPYDLWSKDFDFSRQAIQEHLADGNKDFKKALKQGKCLELIKDFEIKLTTI